LGHNEQLPFKQEHVLFNTREVSTTIQARPGRGNP
jgi:hypothetical protein